jgi:4'-phosphopantetheinyl transferase
MPTYRFARLDPTSLAPPVFTPIASPDALGRAAEGEARLLHVRWNHPEDAGVLARLRSTLSAEETARADRFRMERHRERYILSWGLLRRLLGAVTGIRPSDVAYAFGPHGKPALAPGQDPQPPSFNMSHSGEHILYGLCPDPGIGVDVESVRPRKLLVRIAREHYHPNEVADVLALEGHARVIRFHQYWTLKEAWTKALGRGLGYPIRSLDFHDLLAAGGGVIRAEAARWRCRPFFLDPDVPAACVVRPA